MQADHLQHRAAQIGLDQAVEDHRPRQAFLAGPAQELQAVHAGHVQVTEHDVRRAVLAQQAQGTGAVGGRQRGDDAQALQLLQGQQLLHRMVFQNQYFQGVQARLQRGWRLPR